MEFFVSDTHFGSEKVIAKSKRPFKTPDEMDEHILHCINSTVGRDDVLYHLGDFAQVHVERAMHYRERIRCQNVFLICGNHDEKNRRFKEFRKMFVGVHDILEIKREKRLLVMCHYPIRVWHHWDKGAMMLHGHTHNEMQPLKKFHLVLDVGVDCHAFKPWSYSEVMEYMHPRISLYDSNIESKNVVYY